MKEGIVHSLGFTVAFSFEFLGIGSAHEQTGAVLAYLYGWTSAFILRPASVAIINLTFAQYFLSGIMGGMLPWFFDRYIYYSATDLCRL